jgi:hypothetical protein
VGPEDLMHLLDPNLLAQLDLQGLVDLLHLKHLSHPEHLLDLEGLVDPVIH